MKIRSSVIEEAFYSHRARWLTVVFKTGTTYIYEDFPEENWQEFRDAPSRGSYYSLNIRDKFRYRRLTGVS